MKRLLRYLNGSPRYRWLFGYQIKVRNVVAWPDSDFAGCIRARKSTLAGVI